MSNGNVLGVVSIIMLPPEILVDTISVVLIGVDYLHGRLRHQVTYFIVNFGGYSLLTSTIYLQVNC